MCTAVPVAVKIVLPQKRADVLSAAIPFPLQNIFLLAILSIREEKHTFTFLGAKNAGNDFFK